jgi:hypothetical protein
VRDENPYLREFERLQPELSAPPDPVNAALGTTGMSAYDRRIWCVRRYAFAVPTPAALATLAHLAPIVELGAGTGYWAYLLRRRGVDCVAYDLAPPDRLPNPSRFHPFTWTEVAAGDVDVLRHHADRTLFLCWPPYRHPLASQALTSYAGATLVYVGEPAGGRTADEQFFDLLARSWVATQQVALPNWPGTHDQLTVYRRARRSGHDRHTVSREGHEHHPIDARRVAVDLKLHAVVMGGVPDL